VRNPALILIVDDNPTNVDILATRLDSQGYEIVTASDGEEALTAAKEHLPDLILLDIMMPKIDGVEVCRRLKADDALPFMPIILVTARSETKDIVEGLDSGADEYLTKPVDHASLVARVRSILRVKALHDTVEAQSVELANWNRKLESRVADQLAEIDRMARLKRFLSPQVAELIVAEDNERLLESHRCEVTILFCDLRGFTAFSEITKPEAVMSVLGDYHKTVGELVHEFEGTVERFAGDGVMVMFNDPLPCPDHAERAVMMSLAMRTRIQALARDWREQGHTLGFGIGIAQGSATLGPIGFEGRFDYGAIGTVVNLASRLSDAAADGQILIDELVRAASGAAVQTESLGELELKGFRNAVPTFNVITLDR